PVLPDTPTSLLFPYTTLFRSSHFHGKSTLGVFLGVEGGGSTEMAENVHIHHNYFSDHSFAGANGGEPIRLGVSPRALGSAHAVVDRKSTRLNSSHVKISYAVF